MNIYVGQLSYEVTEEDLRLAFEPFGQVESVTIIKDKHSGQSKGFGFVEMASKAEGQSAIDGLNGIELNGRAISANEARPRTESRGNGRCYTWGGSIFSPVPTPAPTKLCYVRTLILVFNFVSRNCLYMASFWNEFDFCGSVHSRFSIWK